MKIPARPWVDAHQYGHLLFDLVEDPDQNNPIENAAIEKMMIDHLIKLMQANDAPAEQFERMGIG